MNSKAALSKSSPPAKKQEPVTNTEPLPRLKARVAVPALFSALANQLNGDVAVFKCVKSEFAVFAEMTEDAVTRIHGQPSLKQTTAATPVAVFRSTSGMRVADGKVEVRSAQIPQVIFGRVDDLDDNDVIVCLITGSTELPLLAKSIAAVIDPIRVRYGTLYERVKLNDNWTELEVLSEPFVNNESFGFCPVVHVKTRTGENKYLQVSPRSIRDILEGMRSGTTGLIGIKIRIRKKAAAQESGFEGHRIAAFS